MSFQASDINASFMGSATRCYFKLSLQEVQVLFTVEIMMLFQGTYRATKKEREKEREIGISTSII